jgi:hypothetical protein
MQKSRLHFDQMPLVEASNTARSTPGVASPMTPIKAVC